MNGSDTSFSQGHFDTLGTFAPSNTPPGLYEACGWTDKQGYLWLFGGVSQPFSNNHSQSEYGDLWKFDPSLNLWAWIKGPGTYDQSGVYGIKGIPSPTNNPGCRGWGAVTWVDTAGDFWLFGGWGWDVNHHHISLNDLWKYSIATNEWTWMKGSNDSLNLPVYGTIGVADNANTPGGTTEASTSWTDDNNNLWFFGGNFSNNLWKYDPVTNQWTLMKTGTGIGIYGTKGIPDVNNIPGGRWCYTHWKDRNDNLWLFGGSGYDNRDSSGNLNDLWRYTIPTNSWTWMGGSDTANNHGKKGTMCQASIDSSYPPARYETRACWTLPCDNFLFFGGWSGEYQEKNDLWNYSVSFNEWTWMNGLFNDTTAARFGNRTISSSTNNPGCRYGSVSWIDSNGNLWLFGGCKKGSVSLNDLWRFVRDTTCPRIGHPGMVTSAFAIDTNSCINTSVSFTNNSINGIRFAWNFGDGVTTNTFNPSHTYSSIGNYIVQLIVYSGCDYRTDTSYNTIHINPFAVAAFTADSLLGCDSLTVHFTNTSSNATSYHWNFGDGNSSPAMNPTHSYHDTGNFNVTLIAYTSSGCNDTVTRTKFVSIIHPVVRSNFGVTNKNEGCSPFTADFINNSINATNYEWYFGDSTTASNTNPTHVYKDTGIYTIMLIASNPNGQCKPLPDTFIIKNYIKVDTCIITQLYPSLNDGSFTLDYTIPETGTFMVYDAVGQIVINYPLPKLSGREYFYTTNLANALYLWQIISGNDVLAKGKLEVIK